MTAAVAGTDGTTTPLVLHDDGAHADGTADDDLYGGGTAALAGGSYAAVIRAEGGGQHRTTIAAFTVGAAAPKTIFLPLIHR